MTEERAMRVDKVILKAALSTLAAIAILLSVMAAACFAFFPATVMEISYNVGWTETAVENAERAYKQSGDVSFLAFAFEVSVSNGDDKSTEKYGLKLIAHEDFASYCTAEDENVGAIAGGYASYVHGKTYAAMYRNGKTQQAVDLAFEQVQTSFVRNNPVVRVLLSALQKNDMRAGALIHQRLVAIKQAQLSSPTYSATDLSYLDEIIALAERYCVNSGN